MIPARERTSGRSGRGLALPWAPPAALIFVALTMLAMLLAAGCTTNSEPTTAAPAQPTTTAPQPGASSPSPTELVLASTTMTRDSGLLDVLVRAFGEAYPQYTVRLIVGSSAESLKLGEARAADVLLVHSPASEEVFMADGFGLDRRAVMYSDFVVVGPWHDPAQIKGMTEVADAFAAIARARATFLSAGESDGYSVELAIWEAANVTPYRVWYRRTNRGMAETLVLTDRAGGYTLADRSTYLSTRASHELSILVQGDEALLNRYHVIAVKGAKNTQGAVVFTDWITSDHVQQDLIAPFRFEKRGLRQFAHQLFIPTARVAE